MVATVTERLDPAQLWTGETGHISEEMLRRHLPDVRAPIYYFAGPPTMTKAIHGVLNKIGIAERDMRSEEFYGY